MPTQTVLNGAPPAPLPAATISTGGFFWRATDPKVLQMADGAAFANFVAQPQRKKDDIPSAPVSGNGFTGTVTPKYTFDLTEPILLTPANGNVLARLQKRVFKGTGFNTIFRPRSSKPLSKDAKDTVPGSSDNVLQLNLTQETLTFSESLGDVPNRGNASQEDIVLKGISYVQKVDDVTNPKTGQADAPPSGIHFEPGVWLAVPQSTVSPKKGPTLCRMGSIPHGTTINAQGVQPNLNQPTFGSPLDSKDSFPDLSVIMTPFFLQGGGKNAFSTQTFSNQKDDRLPGDLTLFKNPQVDMPDILKDPNTFLRNTLKNLTSQGHQVVDFFKFDITTLPTPTLGGGTANIAFLGGTNPASTSIGAADSPNALAVSMTATFWIETVQSKIKVKGGSTDTQSFQPIGPGGPTFIVGATTGIGDVTVPVKWTQVQYSQNVQLNFNGLGWPHISVATLAETMAYDVKLQKA